MILRHPIFLETRSLAILAFDGVLLGLRKVYLTLVVLSRSQARWLVALPEWSLQRVAIRMWHYLLHKVLTLDAVVIVLTRRLPASRTS